MWNFTAICQSSKILQGLSVLQKLNLLGAAWITEVPMSNDDDFLIEEGNQICRHCRHHAGIFLTVLATGFGLLITSQT